jgi:hypothetical protein
MASSFTKFLGHTQRRNTVGRTPLDDRSARCRDLYLTTPNNHNKKALVLLVGYFLICTNMFNYIYHVMSEFILPPLLLPLDLLPLSSAGPYQSPLSHGLGARNVHLFTNSVHSPVSRHPSVHTCELNQGLSDYFLLGSLDACTDLPSTVSYVESQSTLALRVSNPPRVLHHTKCARIKALPYGVGAAKA